MELKDVLEKIIENEELREKLESLGSFEEVYGFFAENGYEDSPEELQELVSKGMEAYGVLDDNALEQVAGGVSGRQALSACAGLMVLMGAMPLMDTGSYASAVSIPDASVVQGVKNEDKKVEKVFTKADVDQNAEKIEVPEGVTKIDAFVFADCKNLKEVKLPNTIRSICESAFDDCHKIEKIIIPESVTEVSIFRDFNTLSKTKSDNIRKKILSNMALRQRKLLSRTGAMEYKLDMEERVARGEWMVRCARPEVFMWNLLSIQEYIEMRNKLEEKARLFIFPEDSHELLDYLFLSGKNVKLELSADGGANKGTAEVFIGAKVDKQAEKIVVPEGVTRIGKLSFDGCKNLKEVQLPSTLRSIGDLAFMNCTSLEKVNIPEGVTEICAGTFWNCQNLKEVDLPNTLKSIGIRAFINCSNLEKISIPQGVVSIEESTFEKCKSLREVKLPNTITCISNCAFIECESMDKINIPESVTEIGKFAFRICKSLKEINLPSTLRSIKLCAFQGCTNLETVNIPQKLRNIDENAFGHCKNLNQVSIPNRTQVHKDAFYGCENIKIVRI